MEKLLLVSLVNIAIMALLSGLVAGALANLAGFGFWPTACVVAGMVAAFCLGQLNAML